MQPDKWDLRFLELAKHVASWSKDPSTKVGAVLTEDNRIISIGYNGFPHGVGDTEERLNNRDVKYQLTVHAERNAIIFAEKSLLYATLYTWPFMACPVCAGMIIQSRILRHVAPIADNPRWNDSWKLSQMMFDEAGIKVDLLDVK